MNIKRITTIALSVPIAASTLFSPGCISSNKSITAVAAGNSVLKFYEPAEIYNYPLYLEKVREIQS